MTMPVAAKFTTTGDSVKKVSSWITPVTLTQSHISESDMIMESFLQNTGGTSNPVATSPTAVHDDLEPYQSKLRNVYSRDDTQQQQQHQHQQHQDWSVPVSNFLQGFRVQAAASLSNAYRTHHPLHRSVNTGAVTTSLAEDIFFLVDVQLTCLHDFLFDADILACDTGEDAIEDALLVIFRCIWAEQTRHRDSFLTSFELCCATANDFFRMMTRMEELLQSLEIKYPFLEWNELEGDTKTGVIRKEANDLASLFVSDAVYAAQMSHRYVMRSLRQSTVPSDLFSRDWEDRWTHNEVIINMIHVFEEYNNELQNSLCNDYLYHKVVVALVRASVGFYVQLLLKKAASIRMRAKKSKLANKFTSEEQRRQQLPFACPTRALCRMMYDIRILQDYFQKISKESASLTRVVADKMNALTVIHEFLGLASGNAGTDSLEEFIVVLHKRSGANGDVTKHFLNDLWYLAAPAGESNFISITVAMLKAELDMVTERIREEKAKNKGPLPPKTKRDGREVAPPLEDMLNDYFEDRIWQEKMTGCGGILKQR